MDRQLIVPTKPRTYQLDPEFWVALLFLRNHWMRDETFPRLIYGPEAWGSAQPLRDAFDFVDCILQVAIDEGWLDPAES